GPGAYGRNDAGDAAMDAAVLAKATGRPVRLQYTRDQGTGWDPKGPASIHRARAALDASGNMIAYDFLSKGFSRLDVLMNESKAADTLAGHLLGTPLKVNDGFGVPAVMDEFAHAVGPDPIAFRLKHLKAPRDIAVIKAAAERAKWETRTSPRKDQT